MFSTTKIIKSIKPLLKRHQVKRASLFGSFARGEENAKSDVDVLVEFTKNIGLFEFINLEQLLEEALGRKVDLVTFQSLHPKLKKYIEKDQIHIL